MNKKIIISIIGIAILALIILLVNNKKTKNQIIEEPKKESNIASEFNEQNNQYTIKDESTGKVLLITSDQATAEEWEDFYKRNPDYRSSFMPMGDALSDYEEAEMIIE